MAPKKDPSLAEENLQRLLGKSIRLYQDNGVALAGKLLRYDDSGIEMTGRPGSKKPTFIFMKKVTAIHEEEEGK